MAARAKSLGGAARWAALAAGVSGAAAGALAAQGAPPRARPVRCADRVPAAALTRVAVYATTSVPDSADRTLVASADSLTQALAARTRAQLGADPAELPAAEPRLTWRDLGPDLLVTAYRDGRAVGTVAPAGPGDTAVSHARGFRSSAPAAALLARVLGDLVRSGERFGWPAGRPGDSVQFRVVVSWPAVARDGEVTPLPARFAAPLFSAAVPWEEPARERRAPRVRYPPPPPGQFVGGTVVLAFVIDTLGRADTTTARDLWPPDRPRPTGELGRYYTAFVASARAGLAGARYTPARLAGCRVPQRVHQPFEFRAVR